MKIKLINKDKPITKMWCFTLRGYSSAIVEDINSGKQVEVEKVPKPAWDYVEEINTVKAKPIKAKKQNKGKSPKGE